MTANRKDDNQFVILKNIVPSRYSIDLLILQSVQHHLKISPSGRKGLLMSFVKRLQIEQTFWEDYDLPDGTLCVLLSLAVWPYWILRWETSLGFLLKKSVKFPGMSVLRVTLSIALDVSDSRHHIVELWLGIIAEENPEVTVKILQKYFSLQRDNLMVT